MRRHVKAHDETLDHLADAVAIFGPEKRLSFHNRAFETLWDLDPVWLAERPTHAELLDRLRQRRRLPETVDYSGFKAKELEFYGATTVAPDDLWSLPDGRTLRVVRQPHPLGGILLLFSDITGELKLKAQYNSLIKVQSATLDKLSDAVAVFGSDGRVRLMNSAFHSFWAIATDDEAPIDFDGVSDQALPLFGDKGFWLELKGRVTDPDPAARAAAEGELKDTKTRHVAWRTQPLPDGATLIVFSDISAKRALEQAVEARERALAESERLKRDFVGNVSYELRTPLTTIIGYSEFLQSLGLNINDKALAHLSAIQTAAGQLARSIDDVLDMAQIDAGEMGLTRSNTALEELLTRSLARALPTAKTRNVELELEIGKNATHARLDPRRIGQVLDHLMDTALRASIPGGRIRLKTSRTEEGIKIEVIDNGRGLPFHVQARIFDRFVGREHGGPGLALALVKALVELHGGTVTVESEPGAGSTFEILLPEKTIADTFVAEGRVGA